MHKIEEHILNEHNAYFKHIIFWTSQNLLITQTKISANLFRHDTVETSAINALVNIMLIVCLHDENEKKEIKITKQIATNNNFRKEVDKIIRRHENKRH